jgi:hypothetical protein
MRSIGSKAAPGCAGFAIEPYPVVSAVLKFFSASSVLSIENLNTENEEKCEERGEVRLRRLPSSY